ncbi:HTH DNA binding protein [Staphylococcus phage vB_SauM_Remus]|uniref:Rep protein n=5 Tax=Silviavirus remus TaxID=1857890 RepID=S4T9A1_9CAUD|nr:Rep protein [Staphylococcus phage vB_SauM_Romulus]YP_008431177.1 HTH DNA binding protein [Staphylococcus phage vB_SauM_Remus]QVD57623.1 Rep protein [Staphylococcus phage PM56]QVD58516.1 Rep protein [Staphylococcus phage PM93]QVD58719.1 Rep protein [Silviavirus remus]QVD58910.1 Rep protein [Staphylococcus phage Romulus]BBM81302.1 putative replication protein [Staphylococcus phage KSAP7]BBM81489.1 putative replication protein [Staphylococcus phage KSAP11]
MTKTERRLYDYIEKKSKNNTYQIATKKELAEELDVSVSTLSKNLKRLEQDNKINVVSKRGNKGGIVISLVRDYDTDSLLHFNDTNDNVITSNLEYATELRNRFFPSYVYERKENKRRTKLEMVQYNASKDKNRKIISDMNFYNSSLPYPTKDIFNMSYDPEGFYKAYILCKLYDQYAIAHMNAKYIQHLTLSNGNEDVDRHKHLSEYYRKKMLQNLSRDSICKDFFGSKTFNTFYNFYLKIKDKNINVFKYMQNVFKNTTFGFENKTQPYPIPAPNFFSSDKYLTNYENYVKGIKRGVNKTNRQIGEVESLIKSSDYLLNPAVAQLHQLYTTPLNEEIHDIDTMFKTALDIEDTIYGIFNGMKHIILLSYNKYIEHLIEKLPSKHKNLLNKFIKQCIVNEYSPTTIPNNARLSMFLMQKEYKANIAELNGGIDRRDLIDISLVNTTDLSKQDIVNIEQTTMNYLHMRRFTSTSYILQMYSNYLGYEVNLTEVKTIIEKYNLFNEIPLTKEGMIEYNKVIDIVKDDTYE